MNKLILIFVFSIFPFFGFSQNTEYTPILDNYYSVKFVDGNVKQTGYYLIENDQPLMHGKWILKANGEKSLVGVYDHGVLETLTVYIDGKPTKYTKHQLDIAKLRARIARLETAIADNE